MKKAIYILILILPFQSCYYDVAEELYPCSSGGSPTYILNVEPVVSQNCYTCHSLTSSASGGGIILEGYDNLIKKVNDGKFQCSIHQESGCSPMPKGGGKLGTCTLAEIDQWISNGAENN